MREGRVKELVMDRYALLYLNAHTTVSYCIAHRILLNAMWQPGWEGNLGENGYMYMSS